VSHAERAIAAGAAAASRARPRTPPLAGPARPGRSLPLSLLVAAAALAAASIAAQGEVLRLTLRLTAAVLCATAALQGLIGAVGRARARAGRDGLLRYLAHDASAVVLVEASGAISWRNAAAADRFAGATGDTLPALLGTQLATPASLVARLQAEAAASGVAREDLITRRGHVRLVVRPVGGGATLWQIDDAGEKNGAGRAADMLGLPLITAGPSGTILYMNDAARRLTGGRPRQLEAVFPEGPVIPGRIHRVEGVDGPVPCLVAQTAGVGGRRELYLVSARDVVREGSSWDGIEDLPVPLLKLSRKGEILAANREARGLLPMSVGVGTRLSELLEGMGRPLADWITDVAEGRPSQGPQFLRGAGDHQDTFLRVSLSLAGPPGDLYLIAVLNDVTELKSLEAQFVQSQKMQAIGQLAGGVAHDFNNLLTAISGHCDLLLLRHGPTDPDYADLIQVHQNANRAASLVGQLLAFSRKQNLMVETLNLRDVLSDLTHLLNRLVGAKVRLILEHDPELRFIRADKRQLEQVVMNLVVNARDAMPSGGEVRIETGNRTLDRPWQQDNATVPPGSWVIVRVTDGGTGIPPERLHKIWEPFYTTKRPGEGTGLGLSTVYGIVKQSGGYVFAESEVGRGTVFTLWLPAQDGDVVLPPEPVAAPMAVPRRGGEVVLLVEDEAPVRAFASRALRLRGYTVLEADNAEAALALLADPALHVDLFVTDVIMPGKDGPTWVREALEARPDVRVIFVSGYAEEAFAEHKALIPDSGFLPKPFSLVELTEAVQAQLAK
jgi:two-component system cell cycle sensor histidine kinase/response regulator CckA